MAVTPPRLRSPKKDEEFEMEIQHSTRLSFLGCFILVVGCWNKTNYESSSDHYGTTSLDPWDLLGSGHAFGSDARISGE